MKRIFAVVLVLLMLFCSALADDVAYPLDIAHGGTGSTQKGDALLSLGAGEIALAGLATGVANIVIPPGSLTASHTYTEYDLLQMFDKPTSPYAFRLPLCCLLTDYPNGRSCSIGISSSGLVVKAGIDSVRDAATLVVVRWLVFAFN